MQHCYPKPTRFSQYLLSIHNYEGFPIATGWSNTKPRSLNRDDI
uniref:Uncharacterized protein n=1 Tax=Arundo donax TaxID=35708 RepID=A0A0A9FVJ2_ARUDO